MRYGIIWPVFRLRLLQIILILIVIGMVWVMLRLPFIGELHLGLILIFPVAVTATVAAVAIPMINDHINERI